MATAVPPNHEAVRKIIEERLQAVENSKGTRETLNVEWRGKQKPVSVISMPVDVLHYNPDTHRIRAQRSVDPAKEADLKKDPFGPSAQAYLEQLLKGSPANPTVVDPSFLDLVKDLREHGQNDPGIITRAGVLINGNTRRAALKEIGQPYIRVGVLDEDASHDDLQAVELSLQLRKDLKREYSFMNFLLAIDEAVRDNRPTSKIISDFRIRTKTFEAARWILKFIEEAIERSRVASTEGATISLRLIDFEEHQGKLEELYTAYTDLKDKSPNEAEMLREQRLLALILEKSKTDLRVIEADFGQRYMKGTLPVSSEEAAEQVKVPGTSIIVPGVSNQVKELRSFVTDVLRMKTVQVRAVDAETAEVTKANTFIAQLDEKMDGALDRAGRDKRMKRRRSAPAERISDACDHLEIAVEAIAQARAVSHFDASDVEEALLTLKSRLIKLALNVTRSAEHESEAVQWLRRVAETAD